MAMRMENSGWIGGSLGSRIKGVRGLLSEQNLEGAKDN